MTEKFSAEEVDAEHRRRRKTREGAPADAANCIHCGRSISALATTAEHGLCDDCLHND